VVEPLYVVNIQGLLLVIVVAVPFICMKALSHISMIKLPVSASS